MDDGEKLPNAAKIIMDACKAGNRAAAVLSARGDTTDSLFEALYNANINMNMISTSEIRISVLVDKQDADKAVQVIHDKFFRTDKRNNHITKKELQFFRFFGKDAALFCCLIPRVC